MRLWKLENPGGSGKCKSSNGKRPGQGFSVSIYSVGLILRFLNSCYLYFIILDVFFCRVELNADLKELITKCCQLTLPQADTFELKKEEELPEGYVVAPLEKEDASDRASISDRIYGKII